MTRTEFLEKQMKLNVEHLMQYRIPGSHPTDTGKCHKCSCTVTEDDIREDDVKYTLTCAGCFEVRYISKVTFAVLQSACAVCGSEEGARTRAVLSNDPAYSGSVEYKEMRALCPGCHAICVAAYWQAADNIIAVREVMESSPSNVSKQFRPDFVEPRTWDIYIRNRKFYGGGRGYESLHDFQSRVLRMNTYGPELLGFLIPLEPVNNSDNPKLFADDVTEITEDGVS